MLERISFEEFERRFIDPREILPLLGIEEGVELVQAHSHNFGEDVTAASLGISYMLSYKILIDGKPEGTLLVSGSPRREDVTVSAIPCQGSNRIELDPPRTYDKRTGGCYSLYFSPEDFPQ